jgi:hypothetical protein
MARNLGASPPVADEPADDGWTLSEEPPEAGAAEPPRLEQAILDRRDALIPTDHVPVLTDDYAPTDALLLLFQ